MYEVWGLIYNTKKNEKIVYINIEIFTNQKDKTLSSAYKYIEL